MIACNIFAVVGMFACWDLRAINGTDTGRPTDPKPETRNHKTTTQDKTTIITMSSRAIRRLRQEQQEALTSLEDDDDESDDEPEQKTGFLDMLDESDEEESSDDDDDDVRAAPQIVKAANTVKPSQEKEEEDIDAILSSFHNERSISHSESADATPTLRSLLLSPSRGYDVQSLDLDHAVRSLLGGANVGGEGESRQRGKGRSKVTAKKYLFGRPRETWGKPPSCEFQVMLLLHLI